MAEIEKTERHEPSRLQHSHETCILPYNYVASP